MARARNIKPGLFKNELLGVADPLYTLLFEGLWVLADRAGRLEDRPLRIRAEVFPYRNVDCDAMLNWLKDNGFIERYVVAGRSYILICEFIKHQNPHKNEPESLLPGPDAVDSPSEKIGTSPENIGAHRADSLSTDSGFPLPDSNSVPNGTGADGAPPADEAKPKRAPAVRRPDDVTEQTWMDWQQLRRTKRASVTETVVAGAREQAGLAGMTLEEFLKVWCRRGSQGLEAAWLKPEERRGVGPPTEPSWRAEQRQRTQLAAPGVAVQSAAEFFDLEVVHVPAHRLG